MYLIARPSHSNTPQNTDIHANLFERLNIARHKKMYVVKKNSERKKKKISFLLLRVEELR